MHLTDEIQNPTVDHPVGKGKDTLYEFDLLSYSNEDYTFHEILSLVLALLLPRSITVRHDAATVIDLKQPSWVHPK